jgi:hypothetical protein
MTRPIEEFDREDDSEDDDGWFASVARIWAADCGDPREDIYTLEDGMPETEPHP